MTRIWKYRLNVVSEQEIAVPPLTQALSVGLDPAGDLCLWAMVKTRHEQPSTRKLKVYIRLTGEPFEPVLAQFLGTVTRGDYVYHIWAENP